MLDPAKKEKPLLSPEHLRYIARQLRLLKIVREHKLSEIEAAVEKTEDNTIDITNSEELVDPAASESKAEEAFDAVDFTKMLD